MQKFIQVRGAREHNLKDVNIDLPRDKLIVITGLSGSGKSSLAFDTIYAEGQRRYVESLSAYARQFLELQGKPDVDSIEGLSPAISIEQKTTSRNPRSTVGTVTEIYDYMRLLWARIGVPYSPATGLPITSQTISQMVDRAMEIPFNTKSLILAPIVRGRKGEFKKEFEKLLKNGFQRAKINGEFYTLENAPELDKKIKHDIDIVVDRVVVKKGIESRLAESLETALRLADGLASIEASEKPNEKIIFSERFSCPISGFSIPEIEPRLFSFNSPHGACPLCDGLGKELKFDTDLVVPDKNISLASGAISAWPNKISGLYMQTIKSLAKYYKFSVDKPFNKLTNEIQEIILFGTGDNKINFVYEDNGRRYETSKTFEGVIPNLQRRYRETESNWMRDELGKYMSDAKCSSCAGKRLKPEALSVRVANMEISEVSDISIKSALKKFSEIPSYLNDKDKKIGERILKEITDRLKFLIAVGLDYLTIGRGSGSLSGGESQRIRLASQIGSGLTGVLYVLDEPSIGLHQKDNIKLIEALKRLRDLGNTVIVVEHDEEAMLHSDHIIDIGPGAGIHGGKVISEGNFKHISNDKSSLTGDYLSGRKFISIPKNRRTALNGRYLHLSGATGNNLKNVSAKIPLGALTCVTGVSGSGKSTFILHTLYRALNLMINKVISRNMPQPFKGIKGFEYLDKIIDIDQSPIGRTPRSNPATYSGAFTPIREWFTNLPESKSRGYKPGRFSFNVKGGRCEACEGDGVITYEMHFLPDVYVECDVCKGKRYNRETLEIKHKEKSIADVLSMSVDESVKFFENIPTIRDKLLTLQKVGLGYMSIGQQATTLSGGEAQRIKLAKELSKRSTGRTIYILDEPTTGLHVHDVKKLLEVLQAFVQKGNTVVVIEHNMEVIKTADWIIDMGPDGGDKGGNIVFEGTPEQLLNIKESYTGKFLKKILSKKN